MKCPIEITPAHLVYDRSRSTTDWTCPRMRYWQYEADGTGYVPEDEAVELFTGTTVHTALSSIATGQLIEDGKHHTPKSISPMADPPKVDIDSIAKTAADSMYAFHLPENALESQIVYAKEQAALIYGMIKGFYQHTWPQLMAKYEIVSIEEEMFFVHDQHGKGDLKAFFVMMVKPDLVLRDKLDGSLTYLEYKTTSSKDENWIAQWNDAVQVHSTINAIEQSLGEKPTHCLVQGLYKGYCLAPDTPVLTTNLEWKPVGDLVVGDKIAGFEETPQKLSSGKTRIRQWREAAVTATGRTKLPCYKLTFEDGSTITCSDQHQWLTAWRSGGSGVAQWTTTEELQPWNNNFRKGHRVIKPVVPWTNNQMEDYDAGYLGGILDGEGHFTHGVLNGYDTTVMGLSQNEGLVLERVKELLQKYNINFWQGTHNNCQTINFGHRYDILRLLGLTRPVRLLAKLNFNKLGGMNNATDPVKLVGKEFLGLQDVVTLSTSTETLIANGFASHNTSYGKQSSPFCYAYAQQGHPPFYKPVLSYEYRNGLRRVPTWELEGGTKSWVENMPTNVLADQYPQTPPIFPNDELITDFFQQRAMRELEIKMAGEMIQMGIDPKVTLNGAFPQRFDKCKPAFGSRNSSGQVKPCQNRIMCHGGCVDPLKAGFTKRVPHHQLEIAQNEAKEVQAENDALDATQGD